MAAPEVFTLVIRCGRRPGDGLPEAATGARVRAYAPGADEAAATCAAVRLLKDAGLEPLEITSHGTFAERQAASDVGADERALIERAGRENAVLVIELTPLFESADSD